MNLCVAYLSPLTSIFYPSEGSCIISSMQWWAMHLALEWLSPCRLWLMFFFPIYIQCTPLCTYSLAFRRIDMVSLIKALHCQRKTGTACFQKSLEECNRLLHLYFRCKWDKKLLFFLPIFTLILPFEDLEDSFSFWVLNRHTCDKPSLGLSQD